MDTVLHQEEENRKKGLITSVILHIILLILCILPLFTFPDPPPGQPSVAISFGAPDVGQGEEEPAPSEIADASEVVPEPAEEPAAVEEIEDKVVEKEVKEVKKTETKPKKTETKKDTKKLTDDSNARKLAAAKKKKELADKKAKDKAKAEATAAAKAKKAKADAAAKAKAAAVAKAAADKKKKEDAKNKFKDIFNGGQGTGKDSQGNSDKPGNAGVEDGKPDATVLSGEGTGNGDVSGFGDREYTPAGPVTGNFQETGTIRLEVCVDRNGKVISAKQKLSGSTTQSATLKKLAVANAKKYKFSKSELDGQCGHITYRFKLQ